MTRIFSRIARYWLLGALFVLSTIFAYTNSPLYGADPTPTPNVATVPRPDQIFTPTPPSLPTIVIITREAPTVNATTAATGNGNPPANAGAEPTGAQPVTNGNGNAPSSGSPAALPGLTNRQPITAPGGIATAAAGVPVIRLTVVTTPTLIWQGVLLHLHFVVSNQGTTALTNLILTQKLPPALSYVTGTVDNAGVLQNEGITGKTGMLIVRWPQLAQGATATSTLTLQVQRDTPNGIFLDNETHVQSSEGATATTLFTLVMPPLELPRFR